MSTVRKHVRVVNGKRVEVSEHDRAGGASQTASMTRQVSGGNVATADPFASTEDVEPQTLVPAEKMNGEQLEKHIFDEHKSFHSGWKQGQRRPNKHSWVALHDRLHREEAGRSEPHDHEAKLTSTNGVNRAIKDTAGVREGTWSASGRVKGWGNHHEGLSTEGQLDGSVKVTYREGSWSSTSSEGEQFDLLTAALNEKGYEVTEVSQDVKRPFHDEPVTERWLEVRKP